MLAVMNPRVFLVCFLFCHVACDISHFSFNNGHVFNALVSHFGFDKGGNVSVSLSVSPTETPFYIVLFNRKQKELQRSACSFTLDDCTTPNGVYSSVCTLPSERRYEVVGVSTVELTFDIAENDQYWLETLNCALPAVELAVEGTVTCINPGGTYLSFEEYPLDPLYCTLLVCYLGLLAMWIWHSCSRGVVSSTLHKLLTVTLALKAFEVTVNTVYYRVAAVAWSGLNAVRYTKDAASVLTSALFLGALLLLALGWQVTRATLSLRERQMIMGSFLLYFIFGLLLSVCQDANLCGAYLLSYYVVKFLITFCIIVAMNANIERLRSTRVDPDSSVTAALFLKLKMFQSFRWAFLAYLVLPILLMFVQVAVLDWQLSWVGELLSELLNIGVYLMVGITFRPTQRNAQLFTTLNQDDEEDGREMVGLDHFGHSHRDRDDSLELEDQHEIVDNSLPSREEEEEVVEIPLVRLTATATTTTASTTTTAPS